jgi:hypothetical protein
MWIALAIAAIGIALGVTGLLVFGKAKQEVGEDKEARKRLEEMARREKKAKRVETQPTPTGLAEQLARLRDRLRRNRR